MSCFGKSAPVRCRQWGSWPSSIIATTKRSISLRHFKKIAPERIEAYTNLSAALMCLHRYDEAQKVIDEGYAKLGGTFSGPFDFMQACIHFHRGELEESDAILAKAQSSLVSGNPTAGEHALVPWP